MREIVIDDYKVPWGSIIVVSKNKKYKMRTITLPVANKSIGKTIRIRHNDSKYTKIVVPLSPFMSWLKTFEIKMFGRTL